MVEAESIWEAENFSNIELNKIAEWATHNKIKFNERKSKVMLMTRRKRNERKEIAIYLNNRPIPQVRRLKYLGIIFDRKLTFKEHINYVTNKCTKLIFTLAKSAKLNWGLNHKALKKIYLGGILPLLLYGVPVWYKAMTLKSYKDKIIRVQRIIKIKIPKAYRTSNETLSVLTGTTPIAIKIEEMAKLYQLTKGSANKDRLCGLVVRVSGYRYRGPGFDPRRYQIF